MKKHIITGLVLALFALVCGSLLALVNFFTAPRIKAAEEKRIQDSIALSCPMYNQETMFTEKFQEDGIVEGYYIRLSSDNSLQAVALVVESQGYASKIRMMIGIDKDLSVTGYAVISQAETKGNVVDAAKENRYSMIGATSTDSIDMIAGTTFSSKAVKNNFNKAFNIAKVIFEREVNHE